MSEKPVSREAGRETVPAGSTRVRVRYADTDRMGVVYYANYLVWFEVGRTEWFRDTGWSYHDMERDGMSLPVIEVHCQYRQPARYDDQIEVRTSGTLLTPIRIRFDYEVLRSGDERPLAIGHTVHAALSRSGRPRKLPTSICEMLAGPPSKTRRGTSRQPPGRLRRLE
jgi:acyl-CoA thioester hydrolase